MRTKPKVTVKTQQELHNQEEALEIFLSKLATSEIGTEKFRDLFLIIPYPNAFSGQAAMLTWEVGTDSKGDVIAVL